MEVTAPMVPASPQPPPAEAPPAAASASRQKIIAITRSPGDAAEFLEMARSRNVKAHALPTIQLVSKGQRIVDEFLDAVGTESPDYVVFMSSKAVGLLFDTARARDGPQAPGAETTESDARQDGGPAAADASSSSSSPPHTTTSTTYERLRLAIANMTVVAVGPKTRESLESEGIRVNEMPPETYSSVGVGEVFTRLNAVGRRVIVPRSGASTPFLKELLTKIGLEVVELHLYDVCTFSDVTEWNGFRAEFASCRIDGIVFTSASSVRGFVDIMSRDYDPGELASRLSRTTVVAIGPFTADELKRHGVEGNVTSDVHTVPGAFETVAGEIDVGRQQGTAA